MKSRSPGFFGMHGMPQRCVRPQIVLARLPLFGGKPKKMVAPLPRLCIREKNVVAPLPQLRGKEKKVLAGLPQDCGKQKNSVNCLSQDCGKPVIQKDSRIVVHYSPELERAIKNRLM